MNPEHPTVINAPGRTAVALLVLSAALLAACGATNGSSEAAIRSVPTKLEITATDYGFEAPETIVGGTVEMISSGVLGHHSVGAWRRADCRLGRR